MGNTATVNGCELPQLSDIAEWIAIDDHEICVTTWSDAADVILLTQITSRNRGDRFEGRHRTNSFGHQLDLAAQCIAWRRVGDAATIRAADNQSSRFVQDPCNFLMLLQRLGAGCRIKP